MTDDRRTVRATLQPPMQEMHVPDYLRVPTVRRTSAAEARMSMGHRDKQNPPAHTGQLPRRESVHQDRTDPVA